MYGNKKETREETIRYYRNMLWGLVAYKLFHDDPLPYRFTVKDTFGKRRHARVQPPFDKKYQVMEALIKEGHIKQLDTRRLDDHIQWQSQDGTIQHREISGGRRFEVIDFEYSKRCIKAPNDKKVTEHSTTDPHDYYNRMTRDDETLPYIWWHRDEYDFIKYTSNPGTSYSSVEMRCLRKKLLPQIDYQMLRDIVQAEMGNALPEELSYNFNIEGNSFQELSHARVQYHSELLKHLSSFLPAYRESPAESLAEYRRAVITIMLKYAPLLAFDKVESKNKADIEETSAFKRVLQHADIFTYENLYV